MKEGLKEKFERNLLITPGCWIWNGPRDNQGYGKLCWGANTHKAHRISYQLYVGEIGALHVLHRCDNPKCVNPDHLFSGTHADNMRDKTLKGRAIGAHAGELHHKAKLKAADVLEMRGSDLSQAQLARKFQVAKRTVSDVLLRKCWRHI